MMRAIVVKEFGDPSVLKVAKIAIPKPKAGQVLVKTLAAGVNPVDTYIRAGKYARLPTLPYTPGAEACGVIHEIGPDVKDLKVGDKVWQKGSITGTCAQYNVCTAQDAIKLHDKITSTAGAGISIAYRTAYRALMQTGQARPGCNVFVHGASGGVGLAAVQIARAYGMRVIGTASTEKGRNLIQKNGCHVALDHSQTDRKAYLEQLVKATDGKGADVIIEMLANKNLNFDMGAVARRGKIVVVGNRGEIDNVNCRMLMMREASVVGCMIAGSTEEEEAEAISAISGGLASGALSPVVGETFPLEDAPAAHVEVIEHKHGSAGKIVLCPFSGEAE